MTALRIASIIAWGALAFYMVPGAWSALFGRVQRRGDAMRLGVLATCVLNVSFSMRWLLAPTSVALWQSLYVLSIGTALGIFWLAYSYGRGPRV